MRVHDCGPCVDPAAHSDSPAVAPSPGGGRCAEGGTPDPCPRDHPARPGVKLETPSVNPGWLVGLLLAGRLVLPRRGAVPDRSGADQGAPEALPKGRVAPLTPEVPGR